MAYKRRFASFFLIFTMLMCVTACSDEAPRKIGKYTSKIVVNSVDSGIVAENDNYEMIWDSERACISVKDKTSGYVWSTIPNDFYNGTPAGARADVLLNSPIIINYIASPNNTLKTLNGSSVFEEGMMTVKKVKNGLQVGYFFDSVEISVPVIYKLYDDHFTVTVDPAGILEGENKVYQVEIAPFLVSAPASNSKDNYLFVPSGSGALMYTDERDGKERAYEEEVYGNDLSVFNDHVSQKTYNASLPVYGVCKGENSLLAVIDEGAAACNINASAGDSTVGYSNACAVFGLRGHNIEVVKRSDSGSNRVNSYSDGMIDSNCTVAFYPLSGEESGYSGMARRYREYLTEKYGMQKKSSDSPLYLQILGGVIVDESCIGFPYKTLEPATTLSQAKEIVSEIADATRTVPTVQLKGYGLTGNDVGEIGGGFKINSKLGKWDDIKELGELCNVYLDFDLVRFNSSGNGFSTFFDSAKAENGTTAYQYYYDVAVGNRDEDAGRYRLLSRNKLTEALEKAVGKAADNDINGISVSTLGKLAYSDYASPDYYSKGKTDSDIAAALEAARKKVGIMTSAANAYAAASSKYIISTPAYSSGYNSLDEDIPFYQMVFKGAVSISTEAVNTSAQPGIQLLKAAETGSGLLYTVTADYSEKFRLADSALAGSRYSDNKDRIVSELAELSELLDMVSDTSILNHSVLSQGVNMTVFENGITVIVNYNKYAVETSLGTVEAESFVYR